MTTRQRHMYETAFDSRVKRDIDDIDRLMQSPVLQGDLFRPRIGSGDGHVVRTASRSSFGSTSSSSTSSTPTHQPMVVARQSPRQLPRHFPLHFTPTERRKVTLIRDPPRSLSPQAQQIKVIASVEPLPKGFVTEFRSSSNNRMDSRVISSYNSERKLSLTNQWDTSRCSVNNSSQESMNVVGQKDEIRMLNNFRDNVKVFTSCKDDNKSSVTYRDERKSLPSHPNDSKSIVNQRDGPNGYTRNSNDIKQSEERLGESSPFITKKAICGHPGIKVLPTDNSKLMAKARNRVTPTSTDSSQQQKSPVVDSMLNGKGASLPDSANSPKSDEVRRKQFSRPCSLATDSHPLDAADQSPQNDDRPAGDYDPPWEFKSPALRPSVNGSVSVPESLSQQPEEKQRVGSSTPPLSSSTTLGRLEDASAKLSALQPLSGSSTETMSSDAQPQPTKPSGPPGRPTLNLNLNLNSNSPKKARQNLTLNFGCSALSVVGEKVDPVLPLEKQGWYHGSISRLDAENLLRVLKEGSYLVRNSESSKQDYSLSLKSARGFMHMKIVHSEGRFILGQFSKPFSSIPEMIHHYSINKLPIKGAEHMSLLYPVIDQLL